MGNVVGGPKHKFLPFKKALLYARSLTLKTVKEWRVLSKSSTRPANISRTPVQVYTYDGWQGHGHRLGTNDCVH